MFPELNNALHLQGTNNVTDDGIFILTTDSVLTNGSFLLVHFVSMYLKRGSDVCMISLDQSLQHYSAVLRKLNINVQQEMEKKKMSFIDILSNPWDFEQKMTTSASSSQNQSTTNNNITNNSLITMQLDNFPAENSTETPSLRKLYETIKNKLNSSSNGICITIDNLNLLLNVYGLNNVISFLQYLQQLIQSKKNCVLIASLHECDPESQSNLNLNSLAHQADIVLSVEELKSGYSRDITGQLSVIFNRVPSSIQGTAHKLFQSYHYKLTESTLKLNVTQ